MPKKSMLSIAAACVIALTASASPAQEALRIGTSGSGSVYYTLGVGLSRMLQQHMGVNSSVETVGGSHANIFALMNDQVDLAFVNAQAASDGVKGKEPFPQTVNACLVAQGQPSFRQVLVRKASGIDDPADLAGKIWITGMAPNPDIAEISAALMKAVGLKASDIESVTMAESSEAIVGFDTGTIDAATLPASAGAPLVAQLMDAGTIDFLRLTPDVIEKMEPDLPTGVSIFELPADTYPNQPDAILVFGIRTYLVANCDLPEDEVYKVASSLLDHVEEFGHYHPAGKEYNIESTVDRPIIPFHPGAIKYLKEKGAWTDELAKKQESY